MTTTKPYNSSAFTIGMTDAMQMIKLRKTIAPDLVLCQADADIHLNDPMCGVLTSECASAMLASFFFIRLAGASDLESGRLLSTG